MANEIVCRDCGYAFSLGPEAAAFFDNGLTRPTRCGGCRAKRRGTIEQGRIRHLDPRGFGFLTSAAGERFYFGKGDLDLDGPTLHVGLSVQFMPGDGTPTRCARRVRVVASGHQETGAGAEIGGSDGSV